MAQAGKNKAEQELEELQKELDVEAAEWDKLGITTDRIKLNGFIIMVRTLAILDILQDKLEIKNVELEIAFKKRLMSELVDARKIIEPQLQAVRESAIRVDPMEAKSILDHRGRKLH